MSKNEQKKVDYAAFMITNRGHIIGQADDTRFQKLPWYKRLWGNIYKPYKDKHIDFKPFTMKKEL